MTNIDKGNPLEAELNVKYGEPGDGELNSTSPLIDPKSPSSTPLFLSNNTSRTLLLNALVGMTMPVVQKNDVLEPNGISRS